MKRTLVWFKTDLRLHDNETLIRAIEQSDEIIPVYCFDDAHFKITNFGFKKTGSFRAQFLLESLHDLDRNLRAIGSGLIIVKGKPEIEITQLAMKYDVQNVFSKQEVAFEELQTQALVQKELSKINRPLVLFNTSTLYQEEELPFSIKDIPDVFTNFRKQVEKESKIRLVFAKPLSINSPEIEQLNLPTFEALSLENKAVDKRAVLKFKGGETAAWERLEHYFFKTNSLSNYKETRNGLVGADYSSKFSAWLALGCISAGSIYDKIKKYEIDIIANESTYWLVFELLWRDYFRLVMHKYGHRIFLKKGIKNTDAYLNNHNSEVFEAWKNGKTGNDFIDANMLELKLTGFMSNRGRQNVASYMCNDLKLDWRYGAAYFEEQLIDYDACSNWGNWAYLAGVGNDPKNNRVFNIEKQANDYDKNKIFRNLWLTKNNL
ncbi:MAG: DASH family cryptochrome [Flavobacteriaceae bacterium]|nr:DASH family cryptochrome [Flavobacteriaceae bacterium]